MEYIYETQGTCSRRIFFELDGEKVLNVRFEGGCSGNTQGLAKLVEGQNAFDIISKLKGTKCGFKATSCPDQLAIALSQALEGKLEF